jgi:hypothetical protein
MGSTTFGAASQVQAELATPQDLKSDRGSHRRVRVEGRI